jgi:hypothetical protein
MSLRLLVSDFHTEGNVETCPRCKATMHEVTRIAPLQQEPGLIAYECPRCSYLTSVFLPAGDEPA